MTMSFSSQLVKIAHQRPDLRPHIRTFISKAGKMRLWNRLIRFEDKFRDHLELQPFGESTLHKKGEKAVMKLKFRVPFFDGQTFVVRITTEGEEDQVKAIVNGREYYDPRMAAKRLDTRVRNELDIPDHVDLSPDNDKIKRQLDEKGLTASLKEMNMDKESQNLLISQGSLDEVLSEYLMDIAVFLMRKMPGELQSKCEVEKTVSMGNVPSVKLSCGDALSVVFTAKDQERVLATVKTSPSFHLPGKQARGGESEVFSIDSSESGIKLISQILSHLGTF